MPACPKHPKFNIRQGVYYRAADPDVPSNWLPKNDRNRATYYAIAQRGDMYEMAGLMGEAQMIHSNETSENSGYLSAARCPACLSETTDPTVKKILAAIGYMCQFEIDPINQDGAPFVFHMEGVGIGAAETEVLVLLPDRVSLSRYFVGYISKSYVETIK